MPPRVNHFYEFGSLRLDATNRLLYRDGCELPLTPKLVETLLVLVERPNSVVDKETLLDLVWGGTAVEEGGIKRNISMLRKALGEEGRFIETLRGRGYRFTGEVKERWEDGPALEATELVVERRANLRVTREEEITQPDESGLENPLRQEPNRTSTTPVPTLAKVALLARLRWRARAVTAAALLLALAGVALLWATGKLGRASTTAPVRSLAVLPFNNLGSPGGDDYLGVGMADVIITRLSALKDLSVRPTTAVIGFTRPGQSSVAAGRALGVDAVLEGSIHPAGDRLRVTVRLIRTSDQASVWAAQFEEKAADLLAVQDAISQQVVAALAPDLAGGKAVPARRLTVSADAYRLYVQGRLHWSRRNNEAMAQAEFFFRQAIDKDPNFALAYVGLADTLAMISYSPEIGQAHQRAIELDPNLGEAYASRGFAAMFHHWDWAAAEQDFRRAIGLSPGYGTARQWYATLLAITGRVEEAKAEMGRALEIDPLSHNFLADMGQMHYFAREYAEAEQYCRRALEASPNFLFAHEYLRFIYLKMGKYDEALEEALKTHRAMEGSARYPGANSVLEAWLAQYREVYRQSGIKGYLRQQIERIKRRIDSEPNAACAIATCHALLGEKEEAFYWLEQALEGRQFLLAFLQADPVFDDLRADPRYQSLLRRMKLGPRS